MAEVRLALMKPPSKLGIWVVLVLLIFAGSAYFAFNRETGFEALERVLNRRPPASVSAVEYWRPRGMGGDGIGVFIFQADRNEFADCLERAGYRLLPKAEEKDVLALQLEIEGVARRIGREPQLGALSSHYGLYANGVRKLVVLDGSGQISVLMWYRPGPEF